MSSAKRDEERKEVKKKKRKEKRWKEIHISRVMEVRSLNLEIDLLWKDLGVKLGEIIEDYNTLLFSKFQKKNICFVRVMSFWRFCVRFGFLSYLLYLSFFGYAALGSYRSWRTIYVRKISNHLDMYWDRFKYLKF